MTNDDIFTYVNEWNNNNPGYIADIRSVVGFKHGKQSTFDSLKLVELSNGKTVISNVVIANMTEEQLGTELNRLKSVMERTDELLKEIQNEPKT